MSTLAERMIALVGPERAASMGMTATLVATTATALTSAVPDLATAVADVAAWRTYRDANPFARHTIRERYGAAIDRGRALDNHLPKNETK